MIDETGVDNAFVAWLNVHGEDVLVRWSETLNVEDTPQGVCDAFVQRQAEIAYDNGYKGTTTSEDFSDEDWERCFENWLETVTLDDVPDKFIEKEYEKFCEGKE